MTLKTVTSTGLTLAALIFLGAGCGDGEIAIPASQMNEPSALQPRKLDFQALGEADAAGSSAPQPAPQAAPVNPNPSQPTTDNMKIPLSFPGALPAARIENKQVTVSTPKGDIVFELYADDAPLTVSNFVYLAEMGYYNGLTFHRYVPGFVIQGGDPLGNGTGGPGYKFQDEPVRRDYEAGTVAMANAGPDTNGSQFFICLEDQPTLPKAYTIFGKVVKGMEVVEQIRVGDAMTEVSVRDR
jgi:cyclophilin family peptidyl-prolyl cis-trans isomerase